MDKPDVDFIEGLVAGHFHRPEDHQPQPPFHGGHRDGNLRLLAAVVRPHRQAPLPQCGRPIAQQTVEQIVDQVMALGEGTRLQVLAPVVRGRKGEYKKLLEEIRREGFVRVRVDGEMREASEPVDLDKNKKHYDRNRRGPDRGPARASKARLADSIETALRRADGCFLVRTWSRRGAAGAAVQRELACPDCGISIEELAPRMFSFNSPYGACPQCDGLGVRMEIDPDLVINQAICPSGKAASCRGPAATAAGSMRCWRRCASVHGIDMDAPMGRAAGGATADASVRHGERKYRLSTSTGRAGGGCTSRPSRAWCRS